MSLILGYIWYLCRKLLVFEVWRVNQFENGIPEKIRILAVVELRASHEFRSPPERCPSLLTPLMPETQAGA